MLYPDDGDFARAYWRVAIEFAFLEARIDELLGNVTAVTAESHRSRLERCLRKGTFVNKVKVLQKILSHRERQPHAAGGEEIRRGYSALEACLFLADDRNDVFHSPIIADLRTDEVVRVSKRYGKYSITSEEVYKLARQIHSTSGGVLGLGFTFARLFQPARLGTTSEQLDKLLDDLIQDPSASPPS